MPKRKCLFKSKNGERRKSVPVSAETHLKAKGIAAKANLYLGDLTDLALNRIMKDKAYLDKVRLQTNGLRRGFLNVL